MAKNGFDLLILPILLIILPLPPKCLAYGCQLLPPIYVVLGIKPTTFCVLGKHYQLSYLSSPLKDFLKQTILS